MPLVGLRDGMSVWPGGWHTLVRWTHVAIRAGMCVHLVGPLSVCGRLKHVASRAGMCLSGVRMSPFGLACAYILQQQQQWNGG